MRIRSFTRGQAVEWIKCGRRRSSRNPTFWLLISVVYTIAALAIVQIPILGEFVLILISPLVVGGAVLLMEGLTGSSHEPEPRLTRGKNMLKSHLLQAFAGPGKLMADALARPENLLVLLELCVIALGLALVGQILISVIAGSAVLENIQLAQMGFFQAWRLVIAAVAAVAVIFVLSTIFVYAVPLSLLGEVTVIGGVYYGVRAAIQNLRAYAIFTVLLLLPLLVPVMAFIHSTAAGAVVSLLSGALFLPTVINSMYCGFKLTFDLKS
jgi:hypothetical protein